jgi:hypothetical protein
VRDKALEQLAEVTEIVEPPPAVVATR